MSYTLIDLELTEQLPSLVVAENQKGIALILRWNGRPIGFVMRPRSSTHILEREELAQLLSREIGTKVLQERLRDELGPPTDDRRFPSLTVAICTKDRPEHLARCLASLMKVKLQRNASQSTKGNAPASYAFEILVIDNAPSDARTRELVASIQASIQNVRYVQEPRPGLDFARNRALCEASGELIAFLDDDVTVDSLWLCGLVEAWAENKDAAAFTGLVLPYKLEAEAQVLFEKRGGFRRGFEKLRYGQTLPGNSVYPCGPGIFGTGCNMAFRRDLLLQLGGFDEALDTGRPLPGGGDLDIFYRIIRAGHPLVYEPKFLAFHEHRHDLEGLRRQYWSWGLGLMAFITKTYDQDRSQRRKLVHLIVWWFQDMARQLVESLLGRHALPTGMVWAELWGGVVGLLGEYARSVKRIKQIRAQYDTGRPGTRGVL